MLNLKIVLEVALRRSMERQKVPFKLDSLCGHVSTTHSSVLFVGMLYCKETILLLLGRKIFFTKQKSKSYTKSREGFDECPVDVAAECLDAHCLTDYEIKGLGWGRSFLP